MTDMDALIPPMALSVPSGTVAIPAAYVVSLSRTYNASSSYRVSTTFPFDPTVEPAKSAYSPVDLTYGPATPIWDPPYPPQPMFFSQPHNIKLFLTSLHTR